jgi:hypothetical protein
MMQHNVATYQHAYLYRLRDARGHFDYEQGKDF